MTSREHLLEIVDSFQEKLNSAEYRSIIEELAKMPPGILENVSDVANIPYNENDLVRRSKQLTKVPFLMSLSESYLPQIGLTDNLNCMVGSLPDKKYHGAGFWVRVGSSEHLFVKILLRSLGFELEPKSLGTDSGLGSTYPYSRLENSPYCQWPLFPILLIEDDIHYIGRRVHQNILSRNKEECWRLGTTFIFKKFDNELLILDKILKYLNYRRSESVSMVNNRYFVRTTYPYSRYQENLRQNNTQIPFEISERDLVNIGIHRCENSEGVQGGTEFLMLNDNCVDFHLLHYIMDRLGYEIYQELTYNDWNPLDIRGYTTNFPWDHYIELEDQYTEYSYILS